LQATIYPTVRHPAERHGHAGHVHPPDTAVLDPNHPDSLLAPRVQPPQ